VVNFFCFLRFPHPCRFGFFFDALVEAIFASPCTLQRGVLLLELCCLFEKYSIHPNLFYRPSVSSYI
jgi:hypothetical protein